MRDDNGQIFYLKNLFYRVENNKGENDRGYYGNLGITIEVSFNWLQLSWRIIFI